MKEKDRKIPNRIEAQNLMDRKNSGRLEARDIGSHTSGHPFLVGEESVLVVWFGAGAFLLDAEGLAEICWLETVV